jgi:hypothetical protein
MFQKLCSEEMTAVTMARPRLADVPPAMARVGMFDFSALRVVFDNDEDTENRLYKRCREVIYRVINCKE